MTRSFSAIYPNYFTDALVSLENIEGVYNQQTSSGGNPQGITAGVVWAVALENSEVTSSGRVIIGADAGWLGNIDSSLPRKGEFGNGDNPQFALNCLSWLYQGAS